jgi:hypothetical protein
MISQARLADVMSIRKAAFRGTPFRTRTPSWLAAVAASVSALCFGLAGAPQRLEEGKGCADAELLSVALQMVHARRRPIRRVF